MPIKPAAGHSAQGISEPRQIGRHRASSWPSAPPNDVACGEARLAGGWHGSLLSKAAGWLDVSRYSGAALAGFLIVCVALPYANTLLNGFVYDDITQVTHNPYLHSFRHLREIFTTTVWSYVGVEGVTNYYRPMMTLGYLVCYQLFGPVAYEFHLVNVLLHAAVVCLVFAVTRRLFGDRTLAFVAAFIFALHPIHSESVAWIAAVTDLELTFFYLLAFWFYLGVRRPAAEPSKATRFARPLAVMGSFVLALLSKEQALTLPFLVTVYEHFYRDDHSSSASRASLASPARAAKRLSRYGPLWLLGAAYVLFRIRFMGALAPASVAPKYTRYEALLSGIALAGQYVEKLLWPVHLSVFYVFHKSATWLDPRVMVGLSVLVLFAALFRVLFRSTAPSRSSGLVAGSKTSDGSTERASVESSVLGLSGRRMASFGIVWLFVTLAPVLNVRWMPANAFAERYLYLPSIGFCWVVAWAWTALGLTGISNFKSEISNRVVPVTGASAVGLALRVALLGIGVLSAVRIVTRDRDWRNQVVLFTRTLAASPDAYPIRNNLGVVYWSQGDVKEAEREWRESLKLAPTSVIVLNNLGLVCTRQKRYAEAVEYFKRAIRLKPDYTEPQLNLGVAYEEMGLTNEAASQYETAVRLSPLNFMAHNRLGKLYADEGRLSEARQQFVESVKSEPNPAGFDGLGDVHLRGGDGESAARAFRATLKLDPFDSHAHFALAAINLAGGKRSEALREYEAGLETDPANSEALAAVQKLKGQSSRE